MLCGNEKFRAGLIGRKLAHSYSRRIHSLLADYSYEMTELETDMLGKFLSGGGWDALNVTIPYKRAVIPYMNRLSPEAADVGAVNTILRAPDGLRGYNTDIYGFEYLLRRSGIDPGGLKTLVLGSGGASRTVCAVLKRMGAEVTVISRSGEDNYGNLDRHASARLIVNTTPVGMYPDNGSSPVDLTRFDGLRAVVDLIYNPARTRLLCQAQSLGISTADGLPMLVAQARRSCEIFLGGRLRDADTERVIGQIAFETRNIILIGMPGSGKTVAGTAVAGMLGLPFTDTDALITEKYGETPEQIIVNLGVDEFRRREALAVAEATGRRGVIAVGGGAVTRDENYIPLRSCGTVVFLRRELSRLATAGRPLSLDLEEMYRLRLPLYKRFADITVDAADDPAQTAQRIISAVKETGEK